MATPDSAPATQTECLFFAVLDYAEDGPAQQELSHFSTLVPAKDHDEAFERACQALRQLCPGKHLDVWTWSTWPRYYTEA